jgi:hypothetical protein
MAYLADPSMTDREWMVSSDACVAGISVLGGKEPLLESTL